MDEQCENTKSAAEQQYPIDISTLNTLVEDPFKRANASFYRWIRAAIGRYPPNPEIFQRIYFLLNIPY